MLRRTAALALFLVAAGWATAQAPVEPPKTTPVAAAQPGPDAPLPIPQGLTPFPGIVSAGQLSVGDFAWAAQNGYRTVVNLRASGEPQELVQEAEIVDALGMSYVHIPVAGAADINVDNARLLAAALAKPGALPAIVHCRSGNRVGALFAIKAHALDGVAAKEALAIGLSAGMGGLEPAVREKLGLPPVVPPTE